MVFLIVMVLCSLMVEACPADFVPEGYTKQAAVQSARWQWTKLERNVTDTNFYVTIILLTCGASSGMMIISTGSGACREMVGMTKMAAKYSSFSSGTFNASGRIAAGALSDKIGRIHTLMIAIRLSVVGAVVFICAREAVTMRSFMREFSVIGISFGAFMCISGIYGGSVWCKK